MISLVFIQNILCFILIVLYNKMINPKMMSLFFRYLILSLFIVIVISFVGDLPLFLTEDSDYILDNFNNFIEEIFVCNIIFLIFGVNLILFIKCIVKARTPIFNTLNPSYKDSRKGKIKIGKTCSNSLRNYSYFLSIEDLEKHMFICGSTGTGKSNFLQNFLLNFTKRYEIPFFLVEFKGEYHFLQQNINNLLILWPGENFSINIFDPLKANPIIHAERIFDMLKSGQFLDDNAEYSPQMEKVLIEILIEVCKTKENQNWNGFEKCCESYLNKNLEKIPMLKQTLISLKNRIRRFSKGPLKAIFETNTNFSVSLLFEKNIILDLSSIIRLGGEKQDALFFLNMILKYLWDKNLTHGAFNYDGIKHITIIEDAQYFAPQDLIRKSKLTSYLEDIALIQRGTGECLITLATRPNISKEILANNGIVITFKNHIEKDIMCELMNLESENKKLLSSLEKGQCLVRINSLKFPFMLNIPLVKRNSLTVSDIGKKNYQVLSMNNLNTNRNNKKCKKIWIYFRILNHKLKTLAKDLIYLKLLGYNLYKVGIKNKKKKVKSLDELKLKKLTIKESSYPATNLSGVEIKKFGKLINELYQKQNRNK